MISSEAQNIDYGRSRVIKIKDDRRLKMIVLKYSKRILMKLAQELRNSQKNLIARTIS